MNKGYVLTMDAVIALIFVVGVFLIIVSLEFFNPEETSRTSFLNLHYISEDVLDVLNKKGILDEVGVEYVDGNFSNSTQMDNGTFIGASNFTKEYLDLIIPTNVGYSLEVDGEVIYNSDYDNISARPIRNDASEVTSSRRLLVGYKKESPVYGDVARSYMVLRGWYFGEGVWNETACLFDPCYCCASPDCIAPTGDCPAGMKNIRDTDVYCFLDNCIVAPDHNIEDNVTIHCYGIAGEDEWGTCSTSAHDIRKDVDIICCGNECNTYAEKHIKDGVNITCYGDECNTYAGDDIEGKKKEDEVNIIACGNADTTTEKKMDNVSITCFGEECTTTADEIKGDKDERASSIMCCGDGDCNTSAEKKIKGDVDITCYGEECNTYVGDNIEGKKLGVNIIGCGNTNTTAGKKIENTTIICYGEECDTYAGDGLKDVNITCYEDCNTYAGHDIDRSDITCCGEQCNTTSDHTIKHNVSIACFAEQCTTHADESIEGKHKDEGTIITCCGDCDTSAGKKIENVSIVCYEECITTAGDNIKDVDIMCYEECNTTADHDLGGDFSVTCCGDECYNSADHHLHHGVDIMCYANLSCTTTAGRIHDKVNIVCYADQCTTTARNETIEDEVTITCCGEECTTTADKNIGHNVEITCFGESCDTTAGDNIENVDIMCCADQCTTSAENDVKGKPKITCCGEQCTTTAGHDIRGASMTCIGEGCSVYVSADHHIQDDVVIAACGNNSDVYAFAGEEFHSKPGYGVYCKGDDCSVYVGANKIKDDVDIYCYGDGCSAVANATSFENKVVDVFCCGAGCSATCAGGENGCTNYTNNASYCSPPPSTPACDDPQCDETCDTLFNETCSASINEICSIPANETCSALSAEACIVPANETCSSTFNETCGTLFSDVCIDGFNENCNTSGGEELLVVRVPYSPPGSKSDGSSNITFYYDLDGDNIPEGSHIINITSSNDTFDPCHNYTNCTAEDILDATDFSFAWLLDLMNTRNDSNTPQDVFPLIKNDGTLNPAGDGGMSNPIDVNSSNIVFEIVHGSNIRSLWGPLEFKLIVWM